MGKDRIEIDCGTIVQMYTLDDNRFILSNVGMKLYVLIGMKTGRRRTPPIKVETDERMYLDMFTGWGEGELIKLGRNR